MADEAGAPAAPASVVVDPTPARGPEAGPLRHEPADLLCAWPRSAAMREALAALEQASLDPAATVLLSGPSGAGKHHAARLFHSWCHPVPGPRPPLVQVDCAALGPRVAGNGATDGNGNGKSSSARSALAELFALARGGTLLLEEVAALWPGLQEPLLQLLEASVVPAGAPEPGVRVVGTTRRTPERLAEVLDPRLRARLGTVTVCLPALRDRMEDVPPLSEAFVRHFAAKLGKPVSGLSDAARTSLMTYDYPGEVRELRTIIEHAIMLARGPLIAERDLALPLPSSAEEPERFFTVRLGPEGAPPPVGQVERQYAARVLRHCAGRRMAAAQLLGLSYPTFLKWLRDLGLD